MNIEKYLAEKAEDVNKALERLMARPEDYPQSLHGAMRYSLFAGGKRLRPALVLAACEAVGARAEAAVNTACAIECIHTYSLIHDDLPALDNDDMRRGRPTCHKAFGEATAILAGDALLTAAFGIIAATPSVDPGVLVRVISELVSASGSTGMIGGQVVDIESEGRDVSFPVVEYIHIHKTGKLILASVRCGAMLGGGGEDELAALTRYAEAAGLAFQIADDILNVEGSSMEMGKSAGSDAARGKATYPSAVGLDESKRRASELTEMAVAALEPFGERAEALRAIARYITSRKK